MQFSAYARPARGRPMNAIRLPNGNLIIPVRAEGSHGLVGDGTEESALRTPTTRRGFRSRSTPPGA